MDMTQAAILEIQKISPEAKVLLDDNERLIYFTDGDTKTIAKNTDGYPGGHAFGTLAGLLDYLQSDIAGNEAEPVAVFVNQNDIVAMIDYPTLPKKSVKISLDDSEEMAALRRLFNPISQKDLWRVLMTDLDGCIPPELAYAISNMDIKIDGDISVKIGPAGAGSKSASEKITVNLPTGKGDKTVDLSRKWEFKGRMWRCFDREAAIELTLEVHTDNGVGFQFHPKRLDKVVDENRAALVAEIRKALNANEVESRFLVFEGA